MRNNKIAGTYELVSAKIQLEHNTIPLFGENPSGSLIFTENMRFNVVLNDLDVPKFSTEDRSQGSFEELRAATIGALALYGTYTLDESGNFSSQHVIGSTFPNWNGLERDSNQLMLQRDGALLIEKLPLENDALVIIEWQIIKG